MEIHRKNSQAGKTWDDPRPSAGARVLEEM
jgi:hypothetical protein